MARHRVGARTAWLVGGGVVALLAVALAVFQPWLLFVTTTVDEALPTSVPSAKTGCCSHAPTLRAPPHPGCRRRGRGSLRWKTDAAANRHSRAFACFVFLLFACTAIAPTRPRERTDSVRAGEGRVPSKNDCEVRANCRYAQRYTHTHTHTHTYTAGSASAHR